MRAYRAALLRFSEENHSPVYDDDGLLVVGPDAGGKKVIRAAGSFASLAERFPGVAIEDWRGLILAPGFVDMHIHYPQTDIIGAPADGLLPWLENYTFPYESRFADGAYAGSVASFFFDELQRHGVTTALTFATSHPASVNAAFEEAHRRQLRFMTGKVLQDRHSPDGVRDETEQSLADTVALIRQWHGKERLGYAITPRFAPTSTHEQLRGAGDLAAQFPDVWIQSHVAENLDEVRWAAELFPQSRSYLGVYEDHGLLRERAVYAHCLHLTAQDRRDMARTGSVAAVCPTSNAFLGSGFFDYLSADEAGMGYGLASDVGGGTSFSPFATMLAAYKVAREGQTKRGVTLSPGHLWWQHTAGAAMALDLGGVVGNLQPGCEADFIAIDPRATPLLARKHKMAESLDELLFALIVLADDRAIRHVVINGQHSTVDSQGQL